MGLAISKVRTVASYIPWLLHLLYYQVSDPCADASRSNVVSTLRLPCATAAFPSSTTTNGGF